MSDEMTKAPAKKTRPAKKNAPKKAGSTENRAAGWMNMEMDLKSGKVWKFRKGYPIFDSEQYPDPDGMRLVELAKKQGGEVTVQLRVTIRVNTPTEEFNIDDIEII